MVVSDDSEVVRYTSQSLIYGDVLVSANNSCGQESTRPALLNIPISGMRLYCFFVVFLLFMYRATCNSQTDCRDGLYYPTQ